MSPPCQVSKQSHNNVKGGSRQKKVYLQSYDCVAIALSGSQMLMDHAAITVLDSVALDMP